MLLAVLGFCVNNVNAQDTKMYDSSGCYTEVMKETASGYKTYDSSSCYTDSASKTSNGYKAYDQSGRYAGSYRK